MESPHITQQERGGKDKEATALSQLAEDLRARWQTKGFQINGLVIIATVEQPTTKKDLWTTFNKGLKPEVYLLLSVCLCMYVCVHIYTCVWYFQMVLLNQFIKSFNGDLFKLAWGINEHACKLFLKLSEIKKLNQMCGFFFNKFTWFI